MIGQKANKMPEYNIDFSEQLTDAARLVVNNGLESVEAKQAVLYLSLLSSEITLKALLEKAGKPVKEIRAHSHDLKTLLRDLGDCEVQAEIAPGVLKWVSAVQLRAVTIDEGYANATVGMLLDAEDHKISKYPNQIRYGNSLRHYPPELVLKMASAILNWARQHWDTVRVKTRE